MVEQVLLILKSIHAITIVFDFISIAFVFIVLRQKNVIFYSIFVMLAATFLWEVGVFFASFYNLGVEYNSLVDRLQFSVGAITFVSALVFVSSFVRNAFLNKKMLVFIIAVGTILAIVSWVPDVVVVGRTYRSDIPSDYLLIPGKLFTAYHVFFAPIFLLILAVPLKAYRKAVGDYQRQIKVLLAGLAVAFTFGTVSAIWLPLYFFFTAEVDSKFAYVLNIIAIDLAGIATSVLNTSAIYALLKYRLMDVRYSLKKSRSLLVICSFFIWAQVAMLYYLWQNQNFYLLFFCLPLLPTNYFLIQKIKHYIDIHFFGSEYDFYGQRRFLTKQFLASKLRDVKNWMDELSDTVNFHVESVIFYDRSSELYYIVSRDEIVTTLKKNVESIMDNSKVNACIVKKGTYQGKIYYSYNDEYLFVNFSYTSEVVLFNTRDKLIVFQYVKILRNLLESCLVSDYCYRKKISAVRIVK